MVRVYWNIGDAWGGLVWSVDNGDISTEVNVKSVSVLCVMETKCNLSAVFPEPKGWLETDNAELIIKDHEAFIYSVKEFG